MLRAEIVLGDEPYEQGEFFESEYSTFESLRIVDRDGGEELVEDRLAIESSVRWTVSGSRGRMTEFAGEFLSGSILLRQLSLSIGLREQELPLQGLVCRLYLDKGVEVRFKDEVVRAWEGRWEESLRTVRGTRREALLERVWTSLREALRLPFLAARYGDRPQLPFGLNYPLRAPSGKIAGVLFVDPVPRAIVGGPHAQLLWAPLRGRVTTQPHPDRSRLTTLVQPHRTVQRLPKSQTFEVDLNGFLARRLSTSGRPRGTLEYHALSVLPPVGLVEGLERTLPPFDHLHEVSYSHRLLPETFADVQALAAKYDRLLPFREALRAKAKKLETRLTALARRKASVESVVGRYRKLEGASRRDGELAALAHFALAEELALLAFLERRADARSWLDDAVATERSEAVLVLALRAYAHPLALIGDAERVRVFSRVARRADPRLARWGGRFLGASDWEGALEAVKNLESGIPAERALAVEVRRAAFRLASPRVRGEVLEHIDAAAGGVPYRLREIVQHPTRLDSPALLGRTLTALGFRRLTISLDTSVRMGDVLPQAAALVPGQGIGDSVAAEDLSRFRWAVNELTAALPGWAGRVELGLIGFGEQSKVWRDGLEPFTEDQVKAARRFLKQLRPTPRSALGAAFPKALLKSDLEAFVIVLDDDAAVHPQLELRVALWNYLRAATCIVVVFSADESLASPSAGVAVAERMSRREWGWLLTVARR